MVTKAFVYQRGGNWLCWVESDLLPTSVRGVEFVRMPKSGGWSAISDLPIPDQLREAAEDAFQRMLSDVMMSEDSG